MGDTRLMVNQPNAGINRQQEMSQTQTAATTNSQRDKTNPFLLAATPLLTLMTQVQNCKSSPDIDKLHAQIANEVKLFNTKLRKLGFPALMIDCATYCLCAALDEAILATPWGTQSVWVQSSLLSMFKGETWGGERFYVIADTLAREPRKNIYVLELIYTLLSLGFEGRYYGQSRMMRDDIRNRLFQLIRSSRGKIEKALSLHWKDEQALHSSQTKRNLLKRMVLISTGLLVTMGLYYNVAAYQQVKPVLKTLHSVAHESPITAYSSLLDRSVFPKKFK